MSTKAIVLEIITPDKRFYTGDVEMLVVKTAEGYEGFMANHSWCCKLLAEEGEAKIKPVGADDFIEAELKGGYINVKDRLIVYADKAEWKDEQQRKYYETI